VRTLRVPASPPLTRSVRSAVVGLYQGDGKEWLAPIYEVAENLRLTQQTRSTAH
jgi:hypothetical protein